MTYLNRISGLILLLLLLNGSQGLDLVKVIRMLRLTHIAYKEPQNIARWDNEFCTQVSMTDIIVITDENLDLHGYCGYNPEFNQVVYSFRGTKSTSNARLDLKKAKVDYEYCDGCKVHRGFHNGINALEEQILQAQLKMAAAHPGASYFTTGHSLGGALALLTALLLKVKANVYSSVYTFGQPRVGNANFAIFVTLSTSQIVRIVHDNDPIPHTPFQSEGYQHSGNQYYFDSEMKNMQVCEAEAASSCSNQAGFFRKIKHAREHKLNGYLKLDPDYSTIAIALQNNANNESASRVTSFALPVPQTIHQYPVPPPTSPIASSYPFQQTWIPPATFPSAIFSNAAPSPPISADPLSYKSPAISSQALPPAKIQSTALPYFFAQIQTSLPFALSTPPAQYAPNLASASSFSAPNQSFISSYFPSQNQQSASNLQTNSASSSKSITDQSLSIPVPPHSQSASPISEDPFADPEWPPLPAYSAVAVKKVPTQSDSAKTSK